MGWLGGLADLCLECAAFREIADGVCAAAPFWTDAFFEGAMPVVFGYGGKGFAFEFWTLDLTRDVGA